MSQVTLRAPCAADAEVHASYPVELEIVRMFGGDPDNPPPRSLDWSKGWCKWLSEHDFGRVIMLDDRPIGEVRLHSFQDGSAKVAIGLFSLKYAGQGVGRRALALALKAGFEDYALETITLKVLAINERAIRCYRACGFRKIGEDMADVMGRQELEWTMSLSRADWIGK